MPRYSNSFYIRRRLMHMCVSIALAFLLSACSLQQHYSKIDRAMVSGRCDQAVGIMGESKSEYGENARLIYLLDSAMIHMECGRFREANTFFHEAEELGEALWTESISRQAASLVTNEYVLPYAGEDFERALINLFSALCYLKLDEYDEALVECRRLDTLLSDYNARYQDKNVYKEDAFGRYISGLIHEASGELDSAYIDYYHAFRVYQKSYTPAYDTTPPSFLVEELVRAAARVDRLNEAKRLVGSRAYKEYTGATLPENRGKVVLIHLNGKSPVKKENKVVVPTPSGPVGVAFPEYVVDSPRCTSSKLILQSDSNTFRAVSELGEDINRIAVKNLDDRKVRVIAKTVARAVAKQMAIKQISKAATDNGDKANRQLVEFLFNTANTLFLEKADTRTWRTLPGEIYISRIFVPEGEYTAYIKTCGSSRIKLDSVRIKKGRTRFLLYSSIY